MGQYLKLVCPSRNEYVSLPGLMKPIERLTNARAMAMIGYLLMDCPFDGTSLPRLVDQDDPRAQEAIDEYIEREKAYEEEHFWNYVEDPPDYILSRWNREYDAPPSENPDEWANFCSEQAVSTYRKANMTWDRGKLFRVAIANKHITELLDYAGRWAGEDVRLVGDYAENGLYSETNKQWIYEYEGEQFTNYATSACPVVPESIDRDDIVHSVRDREPEPGDLARIKHPDKDDDYVYATFVGEAEQDWDDITEGLSEEFHEFVGDFFDDDEKGVMRPDMVLTSE